MFDYFFHSRLPPSPWFKFIGWFFRSLPLPIRRVALRILLPMGSGCLFFAKKILFTEIGLAGSFLILFSWLS